MSLLSRTKTLMAAGTAALGLTAGIAVLAPAAQAAPLTIGQRAVVLAAAQHGKPYIYGAAGPRGFDCSGLVAYVYRQLGKPLPHNAAAQYRNSKHIPVAALRPGDLVFMNMDGASPAGIDHVGIYAGNGNWWVARHSGTTITLQHIWTNKVWAARVA